MASCLESLRTYCVKDWPESAPGILNKIYPHNENVHLPQGKGVQSVHTKQRERDGGSVRM